LVFTRSFASFLLVRGFVVPLVVVALTSAAVATVPTKLVTRQAVGEPARVDGCAGARACSEWVHYPATPSRTVIETGFSRSRAHFYVWSKADGAPRDLDIFVTPGGGDGPARSSGHVVPGFGGELRWLEGERLWHWWGCGTACVMAKLYDATGAVRHAETGSWAEVAPDARRVLVLDYGGSVVLIDAITLARFASGPIPGAGFPDEVSWSAAGVRVVFIEAIGQPRTRSIVVTCVPATAGKLDCQRAPDALHR